MLRQSLSGSVKIISLNRDELLAVLRAIAGQLCAEQPEVESVRLFGSTARGDQVGTSDVDVLIVLRGGGQIDPLQQIRRFYPYFDLPVGVDLLVYTEEEVARRLQDGDAFVTRMWEESVALPGGD